MQHLNFRCSVIRKNAEVIEPWAKVFFDIIGFHK
uniref:Uncharacterized protein n=1 Tax=Siphoviridae sp. ctP6113 TaxID=2826318 RepID=A0A8S5MUX3_9CAUD|nr:MAG TPA: hypothetical protein [Siphoviridae sp. ctP6113]